MFEEEGDWPYPLRHIAQELSVTGQAARKGGGGLFEVATPWNYCQGIYFASVLLDAASYVDGSIEEIRIRGADFSLPGRGLKVECSAGAGKCPPC